MRRRKVLKSAGCLLMLPALESLGQEPEGDDAVKANRLFCMNIGNGMCSDNFPTSIGKDYQSSSTFHPLEHLKHDFTLCTNLRNYGNHESTMYAFAEYSDHTNPQLIQDSVDEIAASHIGNETRIRNLVVEQRHSYGISWKGGLPVSPITNGQILFETIFGKVDKKKREELLVLKKSMLDASRDDAKSLMRRVSEADRVKLDEYFSSLRESEKSLQRSERWLSQEHVDVPFPENVPFKTDGLTEYLQKILKCSYFNERSTYLDLLFLAFKFDITRVVNFYMVGLDHDHHITTHNVPKSEDARQSLTKYDSSFYSLLSNFYDKLSATKVDAGGTLMDETVTVATGNNSISQSMGPHNGNAIPVFVAGGQFSNHGGHVMRKGETTCDIYLSILQKFGIKRDQFGNSRKAIQL